jgi:hypothetical protein
VFYRCCSLLFDLAPRPQLPTTSSLATLPAIVVRIVIVIISFRIGDVRL